MWVGVIATHRPHYLQECPGTHFIRMSPRAGLDGRLHQDSIPGPSSPLARRCTDCAIQANLEALLLQLDYICHLLCVCVTVG
jgi:hypothetical protein